MNLGIDFHLYKSSNNFAAKEYAIYELNPFNRQISLLEHNIVLPVAQEPPDEYSKDALINIPWPAGNVDQEQMVAIINDYLKISSCVIVRDESIKNFILNLCNVNLSLTKITSLSELGYIEIIPKRNACNYHDTQDSNCVVVNAKNMLSWYIEYFSILLI
ncbi:hypothetical protein KQX54_019316 [Cotesia glomerata]|uniref:Uncharacterized protein n=1 Tax=Cotesia glomerata TaxID=32391 RepID=A0AAV7I836_COTGL|nr:hypothetical protein KQX54_019316 [Cotesia glomerata]